MDQKVNLKEQFLQEKPEKAEKANTEVEIGEEAAEEREQSRLIIFFFDTISNFEASHQGTAGCLYGIFISFVISFLLMVHDSHFKNIPYLEMSFVSILMMFAYNFNTITNNNILPYVREEILNTVAKKTGMLFLIMLVCFVASLNYPLPQVQIFIFLSSWVLSGAFEIFIQHEDYDRQEMGMSMFTLGAAAFALDIPTALLVNTLDLSLVGILLALIAGVSLTYCADTLRQLSFQNVFTISHVIGLMTIIFLPLFFPIEGLVAPNILDWLFFAFVALILYFTLPVFIRSFAVQRQSVVLHFLNWIIPFNVLLSPIFGTMPSFFQIASSGVIVGCSLVLIAFQKVKVHSGSFYLQRDQQDDKQQQQDRPKTGLEMNLWKN